MRGASDETVRDDSELLIPFSHQNKGVCVSFFNVGKPAKNRHLAPFTLPADLGLIVNFSCIKVQSSSPSRPFSLPAVTLKY